MMRLFSLLILLLASPLWAAPEFPELTGRVVDNANLMTAAQRQSLSQALASAEQNTSNQVVVVTLADLQGYEIADYGYQLGRHWGIGSKESDNGVLLIVAPNDRKVRIEVGYGLEGVLTDALSSVIIQRTFRFTPLGLAFCFFPFSNTHPASGVRASRYPRHSGSSLLIGDVR